MNGRILGIDIGSFKITAIIAERTDTGLNVIGVGTQKAQGVKKGVINNIELAAKSIKEALTSAQRVAGTEFEQVIVSISGAYTKSIESSGYVNIPEHDINLSEIRRAMQMADEAANIPTGYEKIHILPYSFKVDNQANIEDPLGMNGTRLEVLTHIIIAEKSPILNLRKAVSLAGIEIDNLVLSGYASAIATLTDDEKELGAAVVDMGGETCNVVIHSGNSLRYNDFLEVGSNTITYDLSRMLHTPVPQAEEIKLNYSSYISKSLDVVDVAKIGEDKIEQISLKVILDIIYARIHETVAVLAKSLANSGREDLAGAGIVITGGMTKLDGIRRIASAIFDKPVRIARPKPVGGLFEMINDPAYSCAVGLCMYGAGGFTQYEFDSEKNMRYKGEVLKTKQKNFKSLIEPDTKKSQPEPSYAVVEELTSDIGSERDDLSEIATINKESTGFGPTNWLKNIWNKITQLF